MAAPSPVLINGSWVVPRSKVLRPILNPATLEPVGLVADCSAEDVDAAVEAAAAAQPAWWRVPGVEKAKLLREVGAKIRGREHELSTLMTRETGKPLIEAVDCIDWVAAASTTTPRSGGGASATRSRRWRRTRSTSPSRSRSAWSRRSCRSISRCCSWPGRWRRRWRRGTPLVCKPPHQNPLSNLLMAKCYDGLPPGVVNVVTGGPDTGEALVRHPKVDLIAFTGSVAAGGSIAAIAGQELKKVNLELGSVDPFIVFADADLDVAVPGVAWARLLNAGQVCTSPKRIYLLEPIAEEFTRRLLELRADPHGWATRWIPTTDIGPLISAEALATVERQVAEAVQEGATLGLRRQAGCSPAGSRATSSSPRSSPASATARCPPREEIFGPVLSLTVAKTPDEAIAHGQRLHATAWAPASTPATSSSPCGRCTSIKAGTFWINDPLTDNDAGPFGGMRWSGIGRELGEEGLDAFREPKHVHLDYVMERKNYWYPYRERPIPAAMRR